MTGNLAYREDMRDEILDGKVVLMSPRPLLNHNMVVGNIYNAFSNYLSGKKCKAFSDGTDVYLTETDRVIPDVMIICNRDILKRNGIYGVPDLIVEVLSHGTEKKDRGYKMELYERCGVREYWLVDTENHSVEVYLLKDRKFVLDEVYKIFPDYVIMTDEERAEYKSVVPVSLYNDFSVPLEKIFDDLL